MTTTLLSLTVAVLLVGDGKPGSEPRKPSPFAPSLPQLTDEEEAALDEIINRFILADIGKLQGDEAKQARQDFDRLGPEATFALIRGMNRAAKIEHSCPALVIAKKLTRILGASQDRELLEFACDNIGLGIGRSRHAAVLADLRTACMLRRNALPAQGGVGGTLPPAQDPWKSKTIAELTEAALSERGPRYKAVVNELYARPGNEPLSALAKLAATISESENRQLVRDLLERSIAHLTPAAVKDKLKDKDAEIRAAAARAVGSKGMRLGGEVIELLGDESETVRESAHQALVRLNGGTDLGPAPGADESARSEAVKKWRAWWNNQRLTSWCSRLRPGDADIARPQAAPFLPPTAISAPLGTSVKVGTIGIRYPHYDTGISRGP